MSQSFIKTILHEFDPKNLTIARKLRGLTKTDLANLIDKTPGAISQFESSKSKPDALTLKKLAFALGFPESFFSTQLINANLEIDDCHFRSLRSASQLLRNKVIAHGVLLSNLLHLIEERVDLPQEQVSLVAEKSISNSNIEDLAILVRQEWGYGMGPIPNLIRMLESKGIVVSFIPEDSREVNAFSTWYFSRPCIFLVPMKQSSTRMRFSCAHELGHLVMHNDAKPGSRELESEADRFAGAFLFPRDAFIQEFPSRLDWDHLYELKKKWKMSVAAIVRRAFDLNCISERTYRRAFMYLSKTNQRSAEPFEPEMENLYLIPEAIKLILEDSSIEELSSDLSIRETELTGIMHDLGVL